MVRDAEWAELVVFGQMLMSPAVLFYLSLSQQRNNPTFFSSSFPSSFSSRFHTPGFCALFVSRATFGPVPPPPLLLIHWTVQALVESCSRLPWLTNNVPLTPSSISFCELFVVCCLLFLLLCIQLWNGRQDSERHPQLFPLFFFFFYFFFFLL